MLVNRKQEHSHLKVVPLLWGGVIETWEAMPEDIKDDDKELGSSISMRV